MRCLGATRFPAESSLAVTHLLARRRRPKPVEDFQDGACEEQAIAFRAIRNDKDSCIDKLCRRSVDAREGAADWCIKD